MTIRRPPPPRLPPVGRTSAERDLIAMKLLERCRQPGSGVVAVWYGGGSIAIKRTILDLEPIAITWRQADRLAFPEKYLERKPAASAGQRSHKSTGVGNL